MDTPRKKFTVKKMEPLRPAAFKNHFQPVDFLDEAPILHPRAELDQMVKQQTAPVEVRRVAGRTTVPWCVPDAKSDPLPSLTVEQLQKIREEKMQKFLERQQRQPRIIGGIYRKCGEVLKTIASKTQLQRKAKRHRVYWWVSWLILLMMLIVICGLLLLGILSLIGD